jgi:type I restriction enzyme, S subunit
LIQAILSDICEVNPSFKIQTIGDEKFCSFVPMESIDDVTGTIQKTKSRKVGEVKRGYTFFQNKDVLFAKITPCMENGKCAIADNLINGIGFGSTEYHVIRAKVGIIPEWIYYFLRQENVREKAKSWMRGSAGQQRVPADFFEDLSIPLPPLPEQQRIAAILQKADRVRRLRRYARELSESVLQGVFLEMFGESKRDKWDRFLLSDLGEVQGGLQISSKRHGLELKKPYLRVANVYRGMLDLREIKQIELTESEFLRTNLKKGDLLFVEGHGNIDEIGRCAIWDGSITECVHQNHLIRFRVKENFVLPEYISYHANYSEGKRYFKLASNTTSGLNTISTSIVNDLPIGVPPIEAQKKFLAILSKYNSISHALSESERQAEHLFQSLLERAFSGELGQLSQA